MDDGSRTRRAQAALRLAAVTLGTLLISGCETYLPGPCPRAGILAGADRIAILAEGQTVSSPPAYSAEITGVESTCHYSTKTVLKVDVTFRVSASRGAGATESEITLPHFVAATVPERGVVHKEIGSLSLRFGDDGQASREQKVDDFTVTVHEEMAGAVYEVLVGFQLTPEQFEYNQRLRGF